MRAHDVIKLTLNSSAFLLNTYLSDFTDADLLVAPCAGGNPIAWQLGHLIAHEQHSCEAIKPGAGIKLPTGFAENFPKAGVPAGGLSVNFSKSEYLGYFTAQRAQTLALLESLSAEDLDRPAPEFMSAYAPTVGAALNTAGIHLMMHIGQFVIVRRILGKPVLI